MEFNLVLSLIFFVICSTSCSEIEFKQTCQTIYYNNFEVNSYLHFKQIIGFPKLNELFMNETIKFEDWSKDTNEIGEMYQKKDEYNTLIKKFYTDRNVNSFSVSQLLNFRKSFINIGTYFEKKYYQANKKTYKRVEDLFDTNSKNLTNLIVLKRGYLNFELLSNSAAIYIRDKVNEILDKNGISAFGGKDNDSFIFHMELYCNSIAKFRPIKLDLEPDFKNDIYNRYSVYIPVHKSNYNINEKCTNSVDLPEFFREW